VRWLQALALAACVAGGARLEGVAQLREGARVAALVGVVHARGSAERGAHGRSAGAARYAKTLVQRVAAQVLNLRACSAGPRDRRQLASRHGEAASRTTTQRRAARACDHGSAAEGAIGADSA
jgi:hypothetical protein